MTASLPRSLDRLLKEVSRSFYLTLKVLPGAIRPQIGLAYLLARTTDTIADTTVVPPARRLEALRSLREQVLGRPSVPLAMDAWIGHQGLAAERQLLQCGSELLAALKALSADDRQRVQAVLATIVSGQELDLTRFAEATATQIVALNSDAEFEDYTYRVAGCVGEFWTKMCRAHLFPTAAIDVGFLLANGVRFGKGLQMVNILRDLPADLRSGRCYLPRDRLAAAQLSPGDLLEPANEPAFRLLYHGYLDAAGAHLVAGWAYTNALPRSCVRVRLACAWPILLGVRTLDQLRSANVLDPGKRVKVPRTEVRQLIFRTLYLYPWPRAWENLLSGERDLTGTPEAHRQALRPKGDNS